MSGSGISWAICKSAPCSRQTTTPAPDHSVFYRPYALPAAQPTASKHWRQDVGAVTGKTLRSVGREFQTTAQETAKSLELRTVCVHWTTSLHLSADLTLSLIFSSSTSGLPMEGVLLLKCWLSVAWNCFTSEVVRQTSVCKSNYWC